MCCDEPHRALCLVCVCIAHITYDTRMISSRHYLLRVVKSGVKCLKGKKIQTDIYVGNQKLFAMHLLAYTLCVALVFDTSMSGVVAGGDGATLRVFSGKTFPGFKQSQQKVFLCVRLLQSCGVDVAFRKWMCSMFGTQCKSGECERNWRAINPSMQVENTSNARFKHLRRGLCVRLCLAVTVTDI